MLDDLAYINRVDKSGALSIAYKEPDQLLESFSLNLKLEGIKNVAYAAMGGSALAASLSESWPGYKVPFEVVRDYTLPGYVGSDTLCIVSSFSGNTEETLSAFSDAQAKKAQIVVITGGGKLKALAEEFNCPILLIPPAKQPRYAVFYNLKALVEIIKQTNLGLEADYSLLTKAVPFLKKEASGWLETIPLKDNTAKQIALECIGKSVVIYGGPKIKPAAYKWKISFNENSKHIAWTGTYSEFNHNEFIGWSEQPTDKPYCIINLKSNFENKRIEKRFQLSDQLLSGKRPSPIEIQLKGSNLIEQLLYGVLLGDFVSLYTAIAGGINPEPVDLIEKFKKMLV